MEIGGFIFVIIVLVVVVWILFKLKFFQHKILLFLLILLIVVSFCSFNFAFKGEDISIKSVSDVGRVAKLYFSWLTNALNNMKVITNQVIKMNWESNKTT